jgi:hypothetical protein
VRITPDVKITSGAKGSMKDVVYEYVTGPEFSRGIKMIVTAYTQMQNDLETEKRSMLRIWKRREKQIGAVIHSASEMRGEIEGLVSGYKMLPKIEELTLEGLVEEEDEGGADNTDGHGRTRTKHGRFHCRLTIGECRMFHGQDAHATGRIMGKMGVPRD